MTHDHFGCCCGKDKRIQELEKLLDEWRRSQRFEVSSVKRLEKELAETKFRMRDMEAGSRILTRQNEALEEKLIASQADADVLARDKFNLRTELEQHAAHNIHWWKERADVLEVTRDRLLKQLEDIRDLCQR